MDIYKQIIDQRIEKILEEYKDEDIFKNTKDEEKRRSKAFIILGVSSYLNLDIVDTIPHIVDGGKDNGIDSIYIGDLAESEFTVLIFQGKYVRNLEKDTNFPANAIMSLINAVKTTFNTSVKVTVNDLLRPKITEIHSLMAEGYVPKIRCICINNGLKWQKDGEEHIINAKFPKSQVMFEHFNHESMIRAMEPETNVSGKIKLSGKGVVEEFNYKRVLIGKISIKEIAELLSTKGDDIFEKNIRKYLGIKTGNVNVSIKRTLEDSEKRNNFYFFNNGVTMICDKFSYNALSEMDWTLNVENMNIINGGQTCKTIQETVEENPETDFSKVFVLLRLYEVTHDENDSIVTDITIATNSQNPVDLRDLRANEKVQKDLEISIKEYGYTYQRKRGEKYHSGNSIPSSVAAESIFAVWNKKPHLAKYKKKELFGEYYNEIFDNINGAQLIIAVLIFRYCDSHRKKIEKAHIPYSAYFMAMIMGEQLLNEMKMKEYSDIGHKNYDNIVKYFEENKDKLYFSSMEILEKALNQLFKDGYESIESRRLAATFRRFDLIELL